MALPLLSDAEKLGPGHHLSERWSLLLLGVSSLALCSFVFLSQVPELGQGATVGPSWAGCVVDPQALLSTCVWSMRPSFKMTYLPGRKETAHETVCWVF